VTSVLGWRWILSPSRVFPNDLTSLTGHSARTGHQIPGPVGAGNCVTHRDLVIFADQLQVAFAGDQHLAQALAAGTAGPAFGNRIHPRRLVGCLDVPVKNFRPSAWSSRFMTRSRACWVTHAPARTWGSSPVGAAGRCAGTGMRS